MQSTEEVLEWMSQINRKEIWQEIDCDVLKKDYPGRNQMAREFISVAYFCIGKEFVTRRLQTESWTMDKKNGKIWCTTGTRQYVLYS